MTLAVADAASLAPHIRQLAFAGPIALWLVDLAVSPPPGLASRLSRAENERASRFLRDVDRNRYLAAHTALRVIVEQHWDVPIDAQDYHQGPRGGWSLTNLPCFSLSLSYARDRALIGLARASAIGVDLECNQVMPNIEDLAALYFSAEERLAYSRIEDGHKNMAFLRAWTRKEACTKAIGLGLHASLQDLDAGIDDACRTIMYGPYLIDLGSHPVPDNYLAAWAMIK